VRHSLRAEAIVSKSLLALTKVSLSRSESPHAFHQGFDILESARLQHGTAEFRDMVSNVMTAAGFEVSESEVGSLPSRHSCKNLHGILRSFRGDGMEAVALVTPMQLTLNTEGKSISKSVIVARLQDMLWTANIFSKYYLK
jgi:hypothetical protein